MKLITNFKDYYDHIISKYGVDEKVIYIRTKKENIIVENKSIYLFAIAGKIYVMAKYNNKCYFGNDIDPKNLDPFSPYDQERYKLNYGNIIANHGKATQINEYVKNPVAFLYINFYGDDKYEKSSNGDFYLTARSGDVNLSSFSFDKYIPAEEMYVIISNFLLNEKPFINTQTNTGKIQSHGFDLKKSFRPKMK